MRPCLEVMVFGKISGGNCGLILARSKSLAISQVFLVKIIAQE
jgi:hypothetical protein